MHAPLHAVSAPSALQQERTSWLDWPGEDEVVKMRLRALRPRTDALLHLDFHPLNVITDERETSGP